MSIIHCIGSERVSVNDILDLTPFKGLDIENIEQTVERTSSGPISRGRGCAPPVPLEMEGFSEKQKGMIVDIVRTRKIASSK